MIESVKTAPPNYKPVALSSNGMIPGVPKIIYIRNYTGEELELYTYATDRNKKSTLLKLLSQMIWMEAEPFDVYLLPYPDILKALLTVYANFWSPEMEFEYTPAASELKILKAAMPEVHDAYLKKMHRFYVKVDLSKIDDEVLNEPEDLSVDVDGTAYQFIYPRFGHEALIENEIEKTLFEDYPKMQAIERQLKKSLTEGANQLQLQYEDSVAYEEFVQKKAILISKLITGSLLVKINDEDVSGLPYIERYNKLPANAVRQINRKYKEIPNYGLNSEVKVISPVTQKEVTRRFSFRRNTFIPTLDT